jgi:D-alanyl-D-alanine carboxypeptidase/D-alanyl-D-alanine-endopeptidase (penicillin-binding protein 4)
VWTVRVVAGLTFHRTRISRMKHRLPVGAGRWAGLFAALVLSAAVSAARADVESEVGAVLKERVLHKATVGVQVMKLGSSPADLAELYNRDGHVPLTPASNLKLVTTAAALEKLGSDFKFRTALYLRGQDLVLIGDGDPTFGDGAFLKKVGWKSTTVYDSWIDQLRKRGVSGVRDVIVDDSVFEEEGFHPDWPTDQLDRYYEAQVGGMNFNANLADVLLPPNGAGKAEVIPPTHYLKVDLRPAGGRTFTVARANGTNTIVVRGDVPAKGYKTYVTVHDPSLYAANVLADLATAAGVKVAGEVKRDRTLRRQRPAELAAAGGVPATPEGWTVVGVHETPIAAVLARANKDSANLYAEALCKRVGFDPATGTSGSWANGTAAVGAYLLAAGIPASDFQLFDGCGLSKRNVVSPRALVRVLCYEFYGRNRDAYVQSLSVAGVDGTLDDRFVGTDLKQRVFGKSGFVEGVSTLSGYLKSRDGQWYAFSIMVNGIPRLSNGEVKPLQERIVRAIDAEVSPKR